MPRSVSRAVQTYPALPASDPASLSARQKSSSPWMRRVPLPSSARSKAIAQRRMRVALLVEEEGLERGAITRIAGWLDVSASTIGRDIQALLAAGNPIVSRAVDHANRRRLRHHA